MESTFGSMKNLDTCMGRLDVYKDELEARERDLAQFLNKGPSLSESISEYSSSILSRPSMISETVSLIDINHIFKSSNNNNYL